MGSLLHIESMIAAQGLRNSESHTYHIYYGLDGSGSRVRFPVRAGNFFFTTASRTALGPTQPPIQWVPWALSLGVKRPGSKADNSPPSSAEFKECVELYLHSPIRLHGVVLSLSTEATLPLPLLITAGH
jgi:hypothetical protein